MTEIMKVAKHVVLEKEADHDEYYNKVTCVECGCGEHDEQLLLCDKCDRGFHMFCVKPIVVRVPMGHWFCPDCTDYPPQLNSMFF